MEQPRPTAAPKPESTMHKVGRFLSSIGEKIRIAFGQVVSTIGGALRNFTDRLIGISLLAGSSRLAPRNPTELLEPAAQQQAKPLKFGDDQIENVEASLKKLDKDFEAEELPNSAKSSMNTMLGDLVKDDDTGAYLPKSDSSYTPYSNFVRDVLDEYGVTDFQVNEKNVLLVRLAINQFFADDGGYTDEINSFNKKETIESISDFLKKSMKTCEPGGKYEDPASLAKLQIFLAALTGEGISGHEPNTAPPLNPISEKTLIKEEEPEIKTVSMQQQGPGTGNMPNAIFFGGNEQVQILQTLKAIDSNFPDKVAGDNTSASFVFSGIRNAKGVLSMNATSINDFVDFVLYANGKLPSELNAKNVLIVRHAIAQYLNKFPEHNREVLKDLNSPEGRKQYADHLEDLIGKTEKPTVSKHLQIFRAAISETDLANLPQGPIKPQLNMDLKA